MSTPRRALRLLTSVNYLNYIDRYLLAAVLVAVQKDLSLNDWEAGLLATAFIVPYMFTSPLFGWLGDTRPRPWLLAGGATLWSVASLMTGLAPSFALIAASRFLLGIGESAFTVISIPYLSDWFDKDVRGRKLAIFSTALPVGGALGYVLGGRFLALWNWRAAFEVVGIPGLLLAFLISRLPESRKTSSDVVRPVRAPAWKIALELLKEPAYRAAVFGYCAYSFVVGGVAYWIPSYMQRHLDLSASSATTLFGGIAVVCGLLGTIIGGLWGDAWARNGKRGHLQVSALSMAMGSPFFIGCLLTDSLPVFVVCLAVTQFFFFISTSPINVALLDSSPPALSTSAMALAIFACHILGDAISAPLIGFISDQTNHLQYGLLLCVPMSWLCILLWWRGSQKPLASAAGVKSFS
jgi:MFS family permease